MRHPLGSSQGEQSGDTSNGFESTDWGRKGRDSMCAGREKGGGSAWGNQEDAEKTCVGAYPVIPSGRCSVEWVSRRVQSPGSHCPTPGKRAQAGQEAVWSRSGARAASLPLAARHSKPSAIRSDGMSLLTFHHRESFLCVPPFRSL